MFFEKGKPTNKIWYYQLNVGRNIGKTNSLNEKDLTDFNELIDKQLITTNSWLFDTKDIKRETYDLSVNNPNNIKEIDSRSPNEIISEIEKLDIQSLDALNKIKDLL